jgi:hypothetical protein
MRVLLLSLLTLATCLALPAHAQQNGGALSAEHKDVGAAQVRLQKFDQAIGAVSQIRRSPIANVECNGVCYFPNSTQSIAWKCEPAKRCDLRCTVSPPAGGCN